MTKTKRRTTHFKYEMKGVIFINGFTIHAKLPSLNEVIRKNRESKFCGNTYKKNTEKIISRYIKKALETGELKPVSEPCTVRIDWYEKDKRRDVDNIQSSQKFILDALVNNGVLPDDNRKHVTQIYHRIIDSDENKVSVTIETEVK
ncbi:MAG: RusA family crossover junction endodeoxyribonuclease [Ruminococcus sp.]|nr:RusA family crossover junction endodeoxyribonuclease [Ruminococcus sp.]